MRNTVSGRHGGRRSPGWAWFAGAAGPRLRCSTVRPRCCTSATAPGNTPGDQIKQHHAHARQGGRVHGQGSLGLENAPILPMWRCGIARLRRGCPGFVGLMPKRALAPIQKAQPAIVLIVLLRGACWRGRRWRHLQLHRMIMLTSVCTVGRPVRSRRWLLRGTAHRAGHTARAAFAGGCSPAAGGGAVVLHAFEDLFGEARRYSTLPKSRSTWRFSGRSTAPPPVDSTMPPGRAVTSPAPGPRCRENALRLRLQKNGGAGLQHLFQLVVQVNEWHL